MCKTSKSANWKWRMVAFKVKVAPTNPFLRVKLWSTRFFHYCSEWHWWVFAGKLASSIQTMGGCGNLLATKAFARKFFFMTNFTASKHSGNTYFSLTTSGCQGTTNQSLGLCDWGLRQRLKLCVEWKVNTDSFSDMTSGTARDIPTKHSKIVSSQLLSTPKLWAQCNRRT